MKFSSIVRNIGPLLRGARLPRERVVAAQEEKLRKVLRHAYENSEFYHRKFSEAGITADNIDSMPIEAFPTTDKAEFMGNYEQVLTVPEFGQEELLKYDESGDEGLFLDRWHVVHSSGSTGVPRYCIYDEEAWNNIVLGGARSALWGMSLPQIVAMGMKQLRVLYVGATAGSFGGITMVDEACKILRAKQMKLDINEPLADWSRKVRDFNPNFLIGYPSALKILADQLIKEDIRFSVKRIITCGEALTPNVRKYLEDWFGINVTNFYACTESLVLGVEPSAEEGMYLFDDMNYIEQVDGEMYLTALYNYTQPIIRYHITDRLEMLEPFEQGCTFSRCMVKYGKEEDILWFEDAGGNRDFLHPLNVEDYCIEHMLGYQFIQESKQSFRVDVEVASDTYGPGICRELQKLIQKTLTAHKLDYVSFQVHEVSQILPDAKTGKCRLCLALAE